MPAPGAVLSSARYGVPASNGPAGSDSSPETVRCMARTWVVSLSARALVPKATASITVAVRISRATSEIRNPICRSSSSDKRLPSVECLGYRRLAYYHPGTQLKAMSDDQPVDPVSVPRRTMIMLSTTVLAIAGTGYGLIGLLVIIVLVLLIIRLV